MSAEESLHDTYLKSKRYLIFFSGALLLSVFVGFAASNENALLGWKITHPHLASVVIYFAVGYYLAQLVLFWDAQPEAAKIRLQHSFDYWLSIFIGWIALYSLPVRLLLHIYAGLKIEGVFEGDILVTWQTAAVLGLLPIFGALPYQLFLRPRIRKSDDEVAERTFSTTDLLVTHLWRLVFNPTMYSRTSGAQGSKEVIFDPGGTLSKGQNNNEHSWRVNAGFLELLRADGKIQSRFKVEDDGKRLQHTNEPDTVSLRDQYLLQLRTLGPQDVPPAAYGAGDNDER